MKVVSNAPDRARRNDDPAIPAPPWPRWVLALGVAALVAGVVLRFVTTSDLWLDEALSVNVASLPLDQLHEALKQDGAPPLYYVLLHVWMEIFGTGDVAVRALSGIVSVLTIPAIWFAGRRVGRRAGSAGHLVAAAAVLLLATSPYAIRYATETRMYALQMLLVVLGYLALVRALEQPTLGRLAIVAVLTGSLLYTQYWSMYLVAVVGAVLLWRAWRAPALDDRRAARGVIVAFVAGGIVFLPWVPNMLYQSEHTGTPWGEAVLPNTVFQTMLEDFSGGTHLEDFLSYWMFNVLFLLAVFGVWVSKWRYELDLRTRPGARTVAGVFVATILVGAVASYAADTTFQPRYASIGFPLFVLVLAYGIGRLQDVPVRAVVLVLVVVLGFVGCIRNVRENRTQGGDIGRTIAAEYQRGDVVLYCPDQLGPATNRLLDDAPGLVQLVFPTGDRPELVDWVDYTQRNVAADAGAFAQRALDRAGPDHTVWYVSSFSYAGGNEGKCEQIAAALQAQRPGSTVPVAPNDSIFESMGLTRYPSP
jgi:mannosyltransferase